MSSNDAQAHPEKRPRRLRRRHWVSIAFVAVLTIGLAVLFHPEIQRRLVEKYVAPQLDQLQVEHIHILPWSLRVDALDATVFGGRFRADSIAVRYCLSSLLSRQLNLQELFLRGGDIDLRHFTPPPTPPASAPFAGVFASLDTGLAYAIGEVLVDVHTQFADEGSVKLRLEGGAIAEHTDGSLLLDAHLAPNANDSIKLAGEIKFDQLDHGLFNAIVVELHAQTELAGLPAGEQFSLSANLRPQSNPPWREYETADGETVAEPLPDDIQLKLVNTDLDGEQRAALLVDAIYAGSNGQLQGTTTLTAVTHIVDPYLDVKTIPAFEHRTTSDFQLDIASLKGSMDLKGVTTISELETILGSSTRTPTDLSVHQKAALAFTNTSANIREFAAQIDDDAAETVLDLALLAPLEVPFDDPAQALAVARSYLGIDILGIPLTWLDGLVAAQDIVAGKLSGKLTLAGDEDGVLLLSSDEALEISNINIGSGDSAILADGHIAFHPRVAIAATGTAIGVDDLVAKIGDTRIAGLQVDAQLPAVVEDGVTLTAQLSGDVDVDPVLAQAPVKERLADISLPDSLKLTFSGGIAAIANAIRIEQLNTTVAQGKKENIVDLKALQAFNIQTGDDGQHIENPGGDLARIKVADIDLAWLNPFITPYRVEGELRKAEFRLSAAEQGKLILAPSTALELAGVNATDVEKKIVRNLWLSLEPRVTYTAEQTVLNYKNLRLREGRRYIAGGTGEVTIATKKDSPISIGASGSLGVALNTLARQPILASNLPEKDITTPTATELRYRVSHSNGVINIARLNLDLSLNKKRYVNVKSKSGLTIRPQLKPGENVAKHAVGEISLAIDELSAAAIANFLSGDAITFDRIDGVVKLQSDGRRLVAQADKPISVRQLTVKDADGKLILHPFDIDAAGEVKASGQTIDANLKQLALKFKGHDKPALAGQLAATVDKSRTIPLQRLSASLRGELPQLLDQPAVLPDHALNAGVLSTEIKVEPNGSIVADTTLSGLESSAKLAIHTVEMPLRGNMRTDGQGFDFTMPLRGTGASGVSNVETVGEYRPVPDEQSLLELRVSSDLFYLNDILATVDQIKRSEPESAAPDVAVSAPVAVDNTPDKKAFWDLLPYDTRINFDFKQVFYSDYVAFNDIVGTANSGSDKLALNDFQAFFHDSPITVDGGLGFDTQQPEPYTAKLTAHVKDFDLNQFFSELAPNKKSRIEGLFGVDAEIGGTSPNAAQFRNRLLVDLKLNSRDGVFRPLPPDSVLMLGASGALGIIGEGLSYVPTGGFGAGVASRLVNYIAEIEYTSVDVHIKRDTSLDLVIERCDLLSPNIRMAATGAIDYVPGTDIMNSPLDVVANLNMTGKGAAILYSMDLLSDEQDRYGYWMGPKFKVWGSVTESESNLEEIMQTAADGSVTGGITRPLSGLIGNVKHRWFGGDSAVEAAQREAQVASDELSPEATSP